MKIDWVKVILCFILIGMMVALMYQKSLCENSCDIYCSRKCPICSQPDKWYDPYSGSVIVRNKTPIEIDK
jgi:hypothetical protein